MLIDGLLLLAPQVSLPILAMYRKQQGSTNGTTPKVTGQMCLRVICVHALVRFSMHVKTWVRIPCMYCARIYACVCIRVYLVHGFAIAPGTNML